MPLELALLTPMLVLIVVFGIVVIVALVHARPEDIPAIMREIAGVFRRMADRLPEVRRPLDTHPDDETVDDEGPDSKDGSR